MFVVGTQTYLVGGDSIDPNALKNAPVLGGVFDVVGGYKNGNWPDDTQIAALFPKAYLIDYTVFLSNVGNAADSEPGDMSEAEATTWLKEAIARGVQRPILYCPESWAAGLVATVNAAGIARTAWRLHTAHYGWGGTPTGMRQGQHICGPTTCGCSVQADGTQWIDHGTWDENLFFSSFIPSTTPVVKGTSTVSVAPSVNWKPSGTTCVAVLNNGPTTVLLWNDGSTWLPRSGFKAGAITSPLDQRLPKAAGAQDAFSGRTAAQLEAYGKYGFTVIDTAGERYTFGA